MKAKVFFADEKIRDIFAALDLLRMRLPDVLHFFEGPDDDIAHLRAFRRFTI